MSGVSARRGRGDGSGQPLAHRRRDEEGGAVHAERAEHVVLEILAELLAARRLDHLAAQSMLMP
jgi:hypothetical protein